MDSTSTTVYIRNIHCNSCENTIFSTLESLGLQVKDIKINRNTKAVQIWHSKSINSESIWTSLRNAGFDIGNVETARSMLESAFSMLPFTSFRRRKRIHKRSCNACKGERDDYNQMSDIVSHTPFEDNKGRKFTFLIDGMTCSSCVHSIRSRLKDINGVMSVDINLLAKTGEATVMNESTVSEIGQALEDLGYGYEFVSLENELGDKLSKKRSITVQVGGTYCSECPQRLISGLIQRFPSSTAHWNNDDYELSIEYWPSPPEVSIRSIIQAIKDIDSAFEPSLKPEIDIEERKRRMQQKVLHANLRRLVLATIIAIPTFIIGVVFMSLIPHDSSLRQFWMAPVGPVDGVSREMWALFALATPVYFYGSDVFIRKAFKESKSLWSSTVPIWKRFFRFGSMDLLMALGTSVAYWTSFGMLIASAAIGSPSETLSINYFDSTVFLTMFLLMGRLLESFSKSKASSAVSELGKLKPSTGLLLESHGKTTSVGIELLDFGDVVLVRHGESPPCDGIVTPESGSDNAVFDESSITGESKPVRKFLGDPLYVGTINVGHSVTMKIEKIAGQTLLDQIVDIVRHGQTSRASIEHFADLVTAYFVPLIVLFSIFTFVIWLSLGYEGALGSTSPEGGWAFNALSFAIAVLVVACPCGIGLAAPTAAYVGSGLAAKFGILCKAGGAGFESASGIDVICFDKTGTITRNEIEVVDVHSLDIISRLDLLNLVGSIEVSSSHPLAEALVKFCETECGDLSANVSNVVEIAGMGIVANVNLAAPGFERAIIGNLALLKKYGISCDEMELTGMITGWQGEGKSIIYIALEKGTSTGCFTLAGVFSAADAIKPEAENTMLRLKKLGMKSWMITGDNWTTANAIAQKVGIENVIAEVLPNEKADHILKIQKSALADSNRRAKVMMVGDGVNDAAALAAADCGVAMGSGAEIALASAHFVLVSSSLTSILTLIDLSRVVTRRIKFNFAWACVYNIVLIPIAAGAIYPTGARLNPAFASLAMALSSVSVVCSSLLLRLYNAPTKEDKTIY